MSILPTSFASVISIFQFHRRLTFQLNSRHLPHIYQNNPSSEVHQRYLLYVLTLDHLFVYSAINTDVCLLLVASLRMDKYSKGDHFIHPSMRVSWIMGRKSWRRPIVCPHDVNCIIVKDIHIANKMNQGDRQLTKTKITAHILSASTNIKFKCLFTLLWRTTDKSLQTQTTPVQTQNGSAQFNQSLTLETSSFYDSVHKKYSGVETELLLRLISKNKQGEAKLIGRVTYDLGKIMNGEVAAFEKNQLKLEFCSVNGKISVMFEVGEPETVEQVMNQHKQQEIQQDNSNINPKKQNPNSRFKRQSPAQNKSKIGATAPKSPPSYPPIKTQDHRPSSIASSLVDPPQSSASNSPIPQPAQPRSRPVPQPLNTSQRPLSTERSQQINSSIDQIKFKSLEDDFKRQSSKFMHQNEILTISLKQKEDLLIEMDQELKKVMKQLRRDREELGKKMEENVELELMVVGLKGQNSRLEGDIAQATRSQTKIKQLMSKLQRQGASMRKQLTDQISSLQSRNTTLAQQLSSLSNDLQTTHTTLLQTTSDLTNLQQRHTSQSEQHHKQQQYRLQQHKKQQLQLQQMATTINEQKQHINKLVEEAARAGKEYKDGMTLKEKDIGKRKEEVKRLEERKGELEKRVEELESTVIRINEQNEESEIRWKESTEKIKMMHKKDQQTWKSKETTLESEIEQLKLKIAELQQQLQLNKYETAQKITSLQLLQSEQQSLLLENQSLHSENTNLHSKLLELEQLLLSTNDQKAKELTSVQQEQHSYHIKFLELEQQLKHSQMNAKKYEQKIERLEWQIGENRVLMEKLKDGVKKEVDKNEELNKKIRGVSQINERYTGQVRQLQGQISSINQLLEEAELNEKKLRNRSIELEHKLKQVITTLQKSQQSEQQLRKDLTQKEEQNTAKQIQLGHIRNQLQEEKMNIENYKHDLAHKDKIMKELEEKLKKQEDRYREVVGNMNASGEEVKEMLEDEKRKRDQLENKNKELNEVIRKHEKQIKKTNNECQSLKKEIESIKNNQVSEKGQKDSKITQKQQRITQLQNELRSMASQFQQKQQFYKGNITQLMQTLQNITLDHQEQRNEDAQRMIDLRGHVSMLEKKVKDMEGQYEKNKRENIEDQVDLVRKQSYRENQLQEEIELLKKEMAHLKESAQHLQAQIKEQIKQNTPKKQQQIEQIQKQMKYKDQQLKSLQEDIDRLAIQAQQVYNLREQVEAYKQQLQLNQEERFNLEAACNEKNYQVMELQNEIIKLNEDIELMTQRNNEIESLMDEKNDEDAKELKEELWMLRQQVKQLKNENAELKDKIEQKDEEHVVQLIDQHIRLSKSDHQNSNLAKSVSRLPKDLQSEFVQTCNTLRELLKQRKQITIAHEQGSLCNIVQLPKYARMVSLQLQKAKLQLLKDQKKANVSVILKTCQEKIKIMCEMADQCCTE